MQVKRIGHTLPQYFLLKRKFAAYSTEAMLLIFLSCKIKLICLLEKHFLCQRIIEATWNVICIVLDNIEFEGSSKQQYSTCFNCFHDIPIKWDTICYNVLHTWYIVKEKSKMMNTIFSHCVITKSFCKRKVIKYYYSFKEKDFERCLKYALVFHLTI